MKTVAAALRRFRYTSAFAVLALGLAWLAPASAARAQGDVKKVSSLDMKREALRADLQEIRQALKQIQADLEQIRKLSETLKKKQADLARAETILKQRVAKLRAALAKLVTEATSPGVFAFPNASIKPPLLIFPLPKPAPPSPPWPPPWPPPGIFPRQDLPPGANPGKIFPLGTPGGPLGASPLPGGMSQSGPRSLLPRQAPVATARGTDKVGSQRRRHDPGAADCHLPDA